MLQIEKRIGKHLSLMPNPNLGTIVTMVERWQHLLNVPKFLLTHRTLFCLLNSAKRVELWCAMIFFPKSFYFSQMLTLFAIIVASLCCVKGY